MLLQGKIAVIYGAGGSLGGAVASSLAKAGAKVFLTGIHQASVQKTCDKIRAEGHFAEMAIVNALDINDVSQHMDDLLNKEGLVHISFNAIGLQDIQNIPLIDMALQDFLRPVSIAMETQFITCTTAGKAMIKQGNGVILSLTATPGGIGYPTVGGFGPACCAIEGFSRNLASELGPFGVRVVNIRSAGSPDSKPFKDALAYDEEGSRSFLRKLEDDTMLKTLPIMEDIGNAAVFLSSEMASKITGITLDVTCGTTTALNYKIPSITFVQGQTRT